MRVLHMLVITRVLAHAQVVWTPIYFESTNQIDMWTAQAEGCRCSYDLTRQDCACCVREGGCQCGLQSPNRCGQCGIHQYCNSMCNITLSSRNLFDKSSKSYGQIKSPSLVGPAFCWYRLLPDSGQRVEVQIYRLVSVGRFNGTRLSTCTAIDVSDVPDDGVNPETAVVLNTETRNTLRRCEGGFIQLVSGLDSIPKPRDAQICGANERYAPPVVVFEDRGAATLIFQIWESTERSQFLAYFSFTPRNSSQLGFQPRGGRRIERTECDWMYQDTWCRDSGPCRLATPGHPGLYGPNKRCKYLITVTNPHARVRIKFTSLSLPPKEHCSTDFVKVYHGSTTSSPLIATLCGNRKQEVSHTGPNLLVQFSSGPLVSPFHYNGFVASLEFWEKPTTTPPPSARAAVPSKTTETVVQSDALWNSTGQQPCEIVYYSNQSRNGLFDSRGLIQETQQNCTLVFIGGLTELVFISLANYNLRASSCHSVVELYDGLSKEPDTSLIKRICSPISKRTRDNTGRYQDRENYISKGNVIQLNFHRFIPSLSMEDMEYVQGAYLFHDELMEGTPKPSSLCDVEYRGHTSLSRGRLTNPGETEIYWTVDGSLECSQRLVPNPNQSVSINIVSLRRLAADTHCHTECGDGGCKCVTNLLPLDHMDHLQILTDTGTALCCICGPFQEEWLPVGVRSWSALRLVYYVARYNWATRGFEYETDYRFHDDRVCGHQIMTQHSGEINSVNMSAISQMNFFLYQSCTWKLDSKVERQLTIYMSSGQNRPCSAWNISIHEYYEPGFEHAGRQLHTFCSRDGPKNYTLPFRLNIVLIRLRAMTNKPPQFQIKWRSQVVRANTRISGYNPSTASSAHATATAPDRAVAMATVLCLAYLCGAAS